MMWICRVCGSEFPEHHLNTFQAHLSRCVERHGDALDELRPRRPFEGDPELLEFAIAEGDVSHRRPGSRKRPR